MTNKTRLAIFPGTFDPITNGHLDIIRRGSNLFESLIVAVGDNPDKKSLFTQSQRIEMIRPAVTAMANVKVEAYAGLTIDLARRLGAATILRGIRNSADLNFEYQVAMTNRVVAGIETVFIMTGPEYAFISSSLIKQIARMGGDISSMVPPEVLAEIQAACKASDR